MRLLQQTHVGLREAYTHNCLFCVPISYGLFWLLMFRLCLLRICIYFSPGTWLWCLPYQSGSPSQCSVQTCWKALDRCWIECFGITLCFVFTGLQMSKSHFNNCPLTLSFLTFFFFYYYFCRKSEKWDVLLFCKLECLTVAFPSKAGHILLNKSCWRCMLCCLYF